MFSFVRNKISIRLISSLLAVFAVIFYALRNNMSSKDKMSTSNKVETLFQDFWDWRLKQSPEFATFIGNHKYDDMLESYSLQSFENRKVACQKFLSEAVQLLSADEISLNSETKLNLELFVTELNTYLKGLEAKGYLFPINYLEGVHVEFDRLIQAMQFKNSEDYEKLILRYHALPKQISEIIELLKEGIKLNMTNHHVSMSGVLHQIDQLLNDNDDSPFYKPLSLIPEFISNEKRKAITNDVKAAVLDHVIPAFKKLKNFLEAEYLKALRPEIGVFSLPNGENFYQMCLYFHLGFHITPREIHEIGLKEVKKIAAEMEKVIEKLELDMPIKKFSEKIKTDEDFYFKSKDEFLEAYKGLVFNEIEPKLDEIFKRIPKLKLLIEPTPPSLSSGPAAYYLAGTPDGSRPGVFYVNTARVNSSPKYEMMTLALHEAEPGHHLQISYMMEQEGVPEFRKHVEDRKYSDAPSRFPLHTAYIEGWGLYSEYLGHELNMYEDHYFLYGHLSHEMFRACRLVVDTGMHALGWSREKALEYMLENTALHKQELESEINRYITWPGQACAYKIGELKIKELRRKAKTTLGSKFDIKEFHDIVLHNAGPLSLLEQKIEQYIRS